jgi:hypothetical protein
MPIKETVMSNEVIASIIGGIIGIAGAYVGARVTTDRTRRFEASANFRSAFAPTLAKLRFVCDNNLNDFRLFLGSEFPNHAAAIEQFRPFIRNSDAFAKAELAYHQHLEIYDCQSIGEPTVEEPAGAGATLWLIKVTHKYSPISSLAEHSKSIIESLLLAAENDC